MCRGYNIHDVCVYGEGMFGCNYHDIYGLCVEGIIYTMCVCMVRVCLGVTIMIYTGYICVEGIIYTMCVCMVRVCLGVTIMIYTGYV